MPWTRALVRRAAAMEPSQNPATTVKVRPLGPDAGQGADQ